MDTIESDIVSTLAVVDDTPLDQIINAEGDDRTIAESVRRLITEVGRPLSNMAFAWSNTLR
jgi:hypothetical protein